MTIFGSVREKLAERNQPILGTEHTRLREALERVAHGQREFLDQYKARSMDAVSAASAMRDAMTEGKYPRVIVRQPRRDGSYEASILHGEIPEGVIALDATEYGSLYMGLGTQFDGTPWPTEPDPNDPQAFYLEQHHVPYEFPVPDDIAGRQQLAQQFRGINNSLKGAGAPSR